MKKNPNYSFLQAPFVKTTTYQSSIGNTFDLPKHGAPLLLRSIRFGELPTFTKSIIYPDRPNSKIRTTNQEIFIRKELPKLVFSKGLPINIILEGDQDFNTTHRTSFKGQKPIESIARFYRGFDRKAAFELSIKDAVKLTKLRSSLLSTKTQSQDDFQWERAWRGVDPMYKCASSPLPPLISTLSLSQGHPNEYTSEQRAAFHTPFLRKNSGQDE